MLEKCPHIDQKIVEVFKFVKIVTLSYFSYSVLRFHRFHDIMQWFHFNMICYHFT
jgi:hypothetical protein